MLLNVYENWALLLMIILNNKPLQLIFTIDLRGQQQESMNIQRHEHSILKAFTIKVPLAESGILSFRTDLSVDLSEGLSVSSAPTVNDRGIRQYTHESRGKRESGKERNW